MADPDPRRISPNLSDAAFVANRQPRSFSIDPTNALNPLPEFFHAKIFHRSLPTDHVGKHFWPVRFSLFDFRKPAVGPNQYQLDRWSVRCVELGGQLEWRFCAK